jgi:hypothetical protein
MGPSKSGLLVGILFSLSVAVQIGCAKTSQSLENRIAKPDPKKYDSVRDAGEWKNPYLVVPRILEGLPDSAWPYGAVVVVQDIGVRSGNKADTLIEANRTKLLDLMKELGITVERWPSA